MTEVTHRSLALLAGFELGRESAREGMVSGAGDCCRHRLVALCEWAGIEVGGDPHAALLAHLPREGQDEAYLWCGARPAAHVVYGDRLCAGCWRGHQAELES